jgi:hypothetical protein
VLISQAPVSTSAENYFVWPVWAKDNSTAAPPSDGEFRAASFDDFGLIWDFTGKGILQHKNDVVLQARRHESLKDDLGLELYYANVPDRYRSRGAHGPEGFWLPPFDPKDFSNIVPLPDKESSVSPSADVGAGKNLFNFTLLKEKYEERKNLEFFFLLKGGPAEPLYAGRLDPAMEKASWYRNVKPFSFEVRNTTLQRSGVTILNNVINPVKGEKTYLNYTITRNGRVTIQVFTLDGTLVDVLRRENRNAGEYREVWDGTNRGGRAVARGMYFIRVVAPDIDEIRKVMVVK